MKLEITPFPNAEANREQVLKILEEAAEVFSAWEDYDTYNGLLGPIVPLLEECADVITAVCNMVEGLDHSWDFQEYINRCYEKNYERGRYDVTKEHE